MKLLKLVQWLNENTCFKSFAPSVMAQFLFLP